MRTRFFRWLLRNHPEGMMLTKFQMLVRCALFPIQWMIQRDSAYDPTRDIWDIHGKKYAGRALYDLANAEGEIFKVRQINDCTTLELSLIHISEPTRPY